MHKLFHWQNMMHSRWRMHTISCICHMVDSWISMVSMISMVIMITDQHVLIGVPVFKVPKYNV